MGDTANGPGSWAMNWGLTTQSTYTHMVHVTTQVLFDSQWKKTGKEGREGGDNMQQRAQAGFRPGLLWQGSSLAIW